MKTLIIGTTNPAKIDQIKSALSSLGIEVIGLPKNIVLPEIIEDQKTVQENAKKKATTYSKALGEFVLSIDNALYLEGLSPEKQPGIYVRRIPGSIERPNDNDLLQYYTKVINDLGGKIKGYWEYALCISGPNGVVTETTLKSARVFVSKKCDKIISGYPLESIQIEPGNGKYIAEMTKEEQDSFWQRNIGKEICDFVSKL